MSTATAITPQLAPGTDSPRTRLRNAPAIARLMYRTALLANGCWEFQGSRNPKGYGNLRRDMGGPVQSAHRVSWEHFRGPIPADLEVDHTCFNRACVNPDHLELVTHAENVNRGRTNQNHGKAACIQGHAFTAENTRIDKKGKRVCKTCQRDTMRDRRARGVSR